MWSATEGALKPLLVETRMPCSLSAGRSSQSVPVPDLCRYWRSGSASTTAQSISNPAIRRTPITWAPRACSTNASAVRERAAKSRTSWLAKRSATDGSTRSSKIAINIV